MRIKSVFSLFICLYFPLVVFSQSTIQGRVISGDDQKPLVFANVFISNTTKGQQTDEQGKFKLTQVPSGVIDLIVSYIGYETFSLQFRADTLKRPLLLVLAPNAIELEGVAIKRLKNGYEKYFPLFKDYFIGKTNFSKSCKLKNPKALWFMMSDDQTELIIRADELLEIENKALGFTIKYQLEEFRYNFREQYVSFLGYPLFEEMATNSKKKTETWNENRRKAYYGSSQHFFKSLINQKLTEEGFEMYKLIREAKKNYFVPAFAEKRDSTGIIIQQASQEKRHIDSTDFKLSNDASLKKVGTHSFAKYVQYLVRTPLKENTVFEEKKGDFYLDFEQHLYIVYNKEFEEPQFVDGGQTKTPQISILTQAEPHALIEKSGNLTNPLAIIFEGRWSYEKIGELLPIDYIP